MKHNFQEQFDNIKYDHEDDYNKEPSRYILKDGYQEKNPEYGRWYRKEILKGLLEFVIVTCIGISLYFIGTLTNVKVNILNIVFILSIIVFYYLIRSKWRGDNKILNIIDNRVRVLISKQQFLNSRISNIENIFGAPSYHLEIDIVPDWYQIMDKIENGGNIKIKDLIDELNNDESLDWSVDKDKSLYGKSFSFIYDYDTFSNSTKIWSNQLHKFVNEGLVSGPIFRGNSWDSNAKLIRKSENKEKSLLIRKLLHRTFVISPTQMGFKIDEPFFPDIMPEDVFAKFPLYDVISLLILLGEKSQYGANTHIKTFPESISKVFERDGIEYKGELPPYRYFYSTTEEKAEIYESDWTKENNIELYLEPIEYHEFKMKYFTINLKLELYGRYENF